MWADLDDAILLADNPCQAEIPLALRLRDRSSTRTPLPITNREDDGTTMDSGVVSDWTTLCTFWQFFPQMSAGSTGGIAPEIDDWAIYVQVHYVVTNPGGDAIYSYIRLRIGATVGPTLMVDTGDDYALLYVRCNGLSGTEQAVIVEGSFSTLLTGVTLYAGPPDAAHRGLCSIRRYGS